MKDEGKLWTDYTPQEAHDLELNLHERLDITAPLNEEQERCPWPWDPEQLGGAPLGQYHCGYCGAMVMAGLPHIDYRRTQEVDVSDALMYVVVTAVDGENLHFEAETFDGFGTQDAATSLRIIAHMMETGRAKEAFRLEGQEPQPPVEPETPPGEMDRG